MSNYYEKYLKYKSKYLELKNQYGSASEANAAEVNTCSICLEIINGDGITLHCTHQFHRQCLLDAYNSPSHHINCAYCRTPYNETDFTQLGIDLAHVHEYVDPEVAKKAAEDLADMELHFAANRGSMRDRMAAFDRIENNRAIDGIIGRYGSILGALRQYNESSSRKQEEPKKAIMALLKHNPALANYIDPESGRHILSFIDDFEMGIILINAGANRNYVDNAMRKPLSYIDRKLRKRIRTSGL